MAIDWNTVAETKRAAIEFLKDVEAFENRLHADEHFSRYLGIGVGFKETAALKRSSMTLTRELANLRRR